ncbi:putative membrane protein [Serratia proteamaculans]|uniref:hypothetical protein n=1 Tax=Serratia proteamaculans TaxID=28151 RepID=UPI0009F7B760|nr:hypothetical protein [Serratia proteamaculans]SMB29436.1 putative membrane protein [Serratia proteamaculans]
MSITLLGLIWAPLLILIFLLPYRYSFLLLLISSIFQASSLLDVSGVSFPPYILTQVAFILRNITVLIKLRFKKESALLLVFVICSCVITVLSPMIFSGMYVYKPSLGIDENYLLGGVPLSFSSGNVNQIILLLLNLLCFLCVIENKKFINDIQAVRYLNIVLIVFFFVSIVELMARMGFVIVPMEIFWNNLNMAQIGMGGQGRIHATFSEASSAGALIAAAVWARISLLGIDKKSIIFLIGLIFLFSINMSGTAIIGIAAGGAIFMLISNLNRTYFIYIAMIVFMAIFYLVGGIDWLTNYIVEKNSSDSGVHRFGADIFAIELIIKTFGIGVGLGSNRASGFLVNIFSSVGIIGGVLFLLFMVKVVKILFITRLSDPYSRFYLSFLLTMLMTMIISGPDINNPVFWCAIMLCSTKLVNIRAS